MKETKCDKCGQPIPSEPESGCVSLSFLHHYAVRERWKAEHAPEPAKTRFLERARTIEQLCYDLSDGRLLSAP